MSTDYTFPCKFTEPHTVTLVNKAGQTASLRYETGEGIVLRSEPVATEPEPPKPPTPSEWPEFSWSTNGVDVIEVRSGLASEVEKAGDEAKIFVLSEEAIVELNALCQQRDPSILGGHFFTAKPDEFGIHPLTINFGGQTTKGGPDFQGFRIVPSANGYGARFYGKGEISFNLCDFAPGYKGIAQTGSDSDMDITASHCTFAGMRGSQCAGIYMVRGVLDVHECTFEEIGHAHGAPRPSHAYLNHGIYAQWDVRGDITDCFFRTADSHAVQLRGGGNINGILASRTANGVLFGHNKSDRPIVSGTLRRAIIANTEDIEPGSHNTGVCLWAERANVTVSDSIFADEKSVGDGAIFRPQNDATITLGQNVRARNISRSIDVDGHRTKMTGTLLQGGPLSINTRRDYKADGIGVAVREPLPFSLPDLDTMPTPKPGYVGRTIDGILAAK